MVKHSLKLKEQVIARYLGGSNEPYKLINYPTDFLRLDKDYEGEGYYHSEASYQWS